MFNKKDPLIDSVKNIMKENELRREAERKLCEELGIASRKQLPREHLANYDALLEQKIAEALHPNQQKLDVHEPEKDKLTAQDFKMLRSMGKKKEMKEEQIDEVSKKGLLQYTDTALADMSQADFGRGKYGDKTGERAKHGDKRQKGIYLAVKKLAGKAKVNATNEEMNKALPGDTVSGSGSVTKDNKDVVSKTAPKAEGPSDKERASLTNKVKEVMKEEQVDEAPYSAKAARAGKDIGKPGKMFKKIASDAAKRYGSEERGKKVAGAVLAKLRSKTMEEDVEQIEEKAPPGAKFERMVKHIKKKYAKDGLTKQEKSIAYATAWKAKNKEEMKEAIEAELKKNLGEKYNKIMEAEFVARGATDPREKANLAADTPKPDVNIKSAQSTASDVMGNDKPSAPASKAPDVDIKAAQGTYSQLTSDEKPSSGMTPSAPAAKPSTPAPAPSPAPKAAAPAPKPAAPAPKAAGAAAKPATQAPVNGPDDQTSPLAAMRQYNASKEAGAFDNKPAAPAARPAARPMASRNVPMPPRRPAGLRESLEETIKKIIEE